MRGGGAPGPIVELAHLLEEFRAGKGLTSSGTDGDRAVVAKEARAVGAPEGCGDIFGQILSPVGRVAGDRRSSLVREDGEHVVDGGYLPIQAGERRREAGVGVHHGARLRPGTVDPRVHGGLYGGLEGTPERLAAEGDEDDVLRFHDRVVEAARRDEYVSPRGTYADVSLRPCHQARGAQATTGLYDLRSQVQVIQARTPFAILRSDRESCFFAPLSVLRMLPALLHKGARPGGDE